jgi:peptidyl-prolyl cis-trans isomerase SurA
VVTISQVRELVGAREKALRDTYKGKELVEKIKETRMAALNDLIDRQLVLQEFKKKGAKIPDFAVDDHVQTIIRQEFGGDRAAFVRTLQAQGFTLERFKQMEREKIIVQAMRQSSVRSDVVIPPRRIEEFYQQNKKEYATPEQIKLRMIVLKKDPNDPGSREKMLQEIREKVIGGAEFEKMAQLYSEDSTQDSGGDWGWIDQKTLNESLTKVAFSLKPGEASKVVELGENYYLLFVEAKKNATVKPLAEVRDEIEKKLIQTERQKAQQKWIEGLRKTAYIKVM